MSGIPLNLVGTNPSAGVGGVHQTMHQRKGYGAGMQVYNVSPYEHDPKATAFINEDFGTDMSQNVAFGGSPELIFDGGSGGSEWSGTGNSDWDFSDGGKVTLGHGGNNSAALFQDSGTIDTSSFSALTGDIDLDNYTPATQDILFQFGFSGGVLGDQIGINSYIDTGDFSGQSFVIPLDDFNLSGATVNEFTMTVQRSGGHNPHVKFDNFTIQETGAPVIYKVQPEKGVKYHVNRIILLMSAPLNTTLSDNSMPNISASDILGVNVTNGIVFQNIRNEEVSFSATFRKLSDFFYVGSKIVNPPISDGTNTFLYLEADFDDKPIILNGNNNDRLTFTINDNLSSFVELRASVRGFEEIRNE